MNEIKYFCALMKMGHVGAGKYLPVKVYVKANNIMQAIKKAQNIPAIKHKQMPLHIEEISFEEYLQGKQKGEYYTKVAKDLEV